MADREKAPRRAGSLSARSVLPSPFTHKLGSRPALSACSRKIDPQRETHRWSERDKNS